MAPGLRAVPEPDRFDPRQSILEGIPAGQIGKIEDIGNVCCFLASDMAATVGAEWRPGEAWFTRRPGSRKDDAKKSDETPKTDDPKSTK